MTMGEFQHVRHLLEHDGFPSVNLVYKYDLANADFMMTMDVDACARQAADARSLLADGRSRHVFDLILQRVTGYWRDPRGMMGVCGPDQYFPRDIIRLGDRESFVDGGAFDGDTVAEFVQRTGGRFERITAFELDEDNFQRLANRVATMDGADRIAIFNDGLWGEDAEISYGSDTLQSAIGSGDSIGSAVALDSVLADESVSYIKLDVEGAELDVLRGARSIIEAERPKLAVCVYHHVSHLWTVPLAIHELVPDHRIYLRHHTNLEYETVCYAVP